MPRYKSIGGVWVGEDQPDEIKVAAEPKKAVKAEAKKEEKKEAAKPVKKSVKSKKSKG